MEKYIAFITDVAAIAGRSCGDSRGPVGIETVDESITAAACVGAGWLEREGGTVRLTARGLEFLNLARQAGPLTGAGQPAPTFPPASADLLRRMADLSRAHFGNAFGPLSLDGNEHFDAAPLVAAGLVVRDGPESYRLSQDGERFLYANRAGQAA